MARKPDWVNWSRGILSSSALPAASLPMILSWWRSGSPAFPDTILVAAHSQDADFRPLSTYPYQALRGIHILGVRPR